jgi:glycosyltransferase-like protein LARGE
MTIAVALTADRVLRLEAMSRMYGGGPICAAVLVKDQAEASMFVHIWRRKPWLFNHVDATLAFLPADQQSLDTIPINALRNAALQLAVTDFLIMLDVDMVPATASFACFRDPCGKLLSSLIPQGSKRILTVPVFIADLHVRHARTKSELATQIQEDAAAPYCLSSQRSAKIHHWLRSSDAYEVKFAPDFEPFGICRRAHCPPYDERFAGYGFNKISWAQRAEASGERLFVLNDGFVNHMNHMDNEWVSNISVPAYLRTWRRYLAFASELLIA